MIDSSIGFLKLFSNHDDTRCWCMRICEVTLQRVCWKGGGVRKSFASQFLKWKTDKLNECVVRRDRQACLLIPQIF